MVGLYVAAVTLWTALQDGTVARDMRADGRNQVGLLVTATQAEAIR